MFLRLSCACVYNTRMDKKQAFFDDVEFVQPGHVSRRCRLVDDGDIRFVLQDEVITYTYHLIDRGAERVCWVMIYENQLATYQQIATAIGKGERTVQGWVACYREKGLSGLLDAPKCGAPVKVTAAIRKRIVRLRDEKLTHNEIASACNISYSAVRKVLRECKKAHEDKQSEINLDFDQAEASTCEKPIQITPEVVSESPACVSVEESQHAGMEEACKQPSLRYSDREEDVLSRDRSADRILASMGLIEDAQPLYGNYEHAEWAGGFIVLAMLAESSVLRTGLHVYQSFGSAFYGLRTMIVIWVLMALLRIKCNEDIRDKDVRALGRILGLDRAPEVKTLRRKLHELVKRQKGFQWMKALAEARVAEQEGPVRTIEIDGHLVAYSGKKKIGTVYSSRSKQVTKGQTENWVNLPSAGGLFMITSPFNEGLSRMLETVVKEALGVCGQSSLNLVFDRGGYDAGVFARLIGKGHHIITYRKGDYDDIALSNFLKEKTTIGQRIYEYAPYEMSVSLNIYSETVNAKGDTVRRKTKRKLELREIRIVREDGRQTSILTSLSAKEMDAITVAETVFNRTGSQENYFKYMRQEFRLDATAMYETDAIDDLELTHPNPAYVKLEKKQSKVRENRRRRLERYSVELVDCTPEEAVAILNQKGKIKESEKIKELNKDIEQIQDEMKITPQRENISKAQYRRLNEECRIVQNCIKTSAYNIESELVDMLNDIYRNAEKEGRSLIQAALKTSGSIRLEEGKVVIQLLPQSSPVRTRAINQVLEQLNQKQARIPGSNRILYFEQTPVPVPVLHGL